MTEETYSVPVHCLFCGSILEGKADTTYASGDLIPCGQCGQENDYDSVVEIAKEKAVENVKKEMQVKLSGLFKGK